MRETVPPSRYDNFYANLKDICKKCPGFGNYFTISEIGGYCLALVFCWAQALWANGINAYYTRLNMLTFSLREPGQNISDAINEDTEIRMKRLRPEQSKIKYLTNTQRALLKTIRPSFEQLTLFQAPEKTSLAKDGIDRRMYIQDPLTSAKYAMSRDNHIPNADGSGLSAPPTRIFHRPFVGEQEHHVKIISHLVKAISPSVSRFKTPALLALKTSNHIVGLCVRPNNEILQLNDPNLLAKNELFPRPFRRASVSSIVKYLFTESIFRKELGIGSRDNEPLAINIAIYYPPRIKRDNPALKDFNNEASKFENIDKKILKKDNNWNDRHDWYIKSLQRYYSLTPLLFNACNDGHIDVARFLLAWEKKNNKGHRMVNYCFDNSKTTPLFSACYKGYYEIAKLLLENNADPNHLDFEGFSPLMEACYAGNIKIVELLLNYKANPFRIAANGHTPMTIACQNGHVDVIDLLLKRVPNITFKGPNNAKEPFVIACENGRLELAQKLFNKCMWIHNTLCNDNTPLLHACENGHTKVARWLLSKGADINQRDKKQHSPLFCACKGNHDSTIAMLLDQGARSSPVDSLIYKGRNKQIKRRLQKTKRGNENSYFVGEHELAPKRRKVD